MKKTFFRFTLTEAEVDAIVERIAQECNHAPCYSERIEKMMQGVVDEPVLYTRLCCAVGSYVSTCLRHIQSEKERFNEFYAHHAARLGVPQRNQRLEINIDYNKKQYL